MLSTSAGHVNERSQCRRCSEPPFHFRKGAVLRALALLVGTTLTTAFLVSAIGVLLRARAALGESLADQTRAILPRGSEPSSSDPVEAVKELAAWSSLLLKTAVTVVASTIVVAFSTLWLMARGGLVVATEWPIFVAFLGPAFGLVSYVAATLLWAHRLRKAYLIQGKSNTHIAE